MNNNRKIYPIKMDSKTYDTFKIIADAKGLTMVQCMRHALGLYIADNLMCLQIKEAGWEQPHSQPAHNTTQQTKITRKK